MSVEEVCQHSPFPSCFAQQVLTSVGQAWHKKTKIEERTTFNKHTHTHTYKQYFDKHHTCRYWQQHTEQLYIVFFARVKVHVVPCSYAC